MPVVGEDDIREDVYMARLSAIWAGRGLVVCKYEKDRAALDGGLHLYTSEPGSDRSVSQTRIWFQAKGKRATTISAEQFAMLDTIGVRVSVDHVRFWYASPEPVYMILYIEAVDVFLAEDVREIVDRQWMRPTFYEAVPAIQQEVTLKVCTSSLLDDAAILRMLRHRSMRIDGPAFRGRPLGHRFDPLRCELKPLAPDVFDQVVTRILRAHDFRSDAIHAAPTLAPRFSTLRILTGRFFRTLEWQWPLATAFGVDQDDDFRTEAPLEFVHGDCAVLVEASPFKGRPTEDESAAIVAAIREMACKRAVIFVNAPEQDGVVRWRAVMRPRIPPDTCCDLLPVALGSLSFLLLIASVLYLDFAPQLSWQYVNYL